MVSHRLVNEFVSPWCREPDSESDAEGPEAPLIVALLITCSPMTMRITNLAAAILTTETPRHRPKIRPTY